MASKITIPKTLKHCVSIRDNPKFQIVKFGSCKKHNINISTEKIHHNVKIYGNYKRDIIINSKPYCQNIIIDAQAYYKYKDIWIQLSTTLLDFKNLNETQYYRLVSGLSWQIEEQFNFNR